MLSLTVYAADCFNVYVPESSNHAKYKTVPLANVSPEVASTMMQAPLYQRYTPSAYVLSSPREANLVNAVHKETRTES